MHLARPCLRADGSGLPRGGEQHGARVEQLDPEAGIEKEYLLTNDKVWMWKALRLMSKKDVSLLGKISAQGGSMEAAVNHFVEKQKGNAGGEEGGEATAMETE